MSETGKAYLAAVLQSVIIGLSFMFVKIALQSAAPLDLLAHRFALALVAAVIPLALGKARISIHGKDITGILPVALFYPLLFFSLQTFGLRFIASSEAGIIQATAPIFTLLLAMPLLGERSNATQIFFILLSVAGVLFVSVMKGVRAEGYAVSGVLLVLGSTLSGGFYNVLARRFSRRFSVYNMTFAMALLGFCVFTGICLIRHAAADGLNAFFAPLANPSYLAAVIYLGVLSSFCSSFLSNYALSKISASKMGVFGNLPTAIALFAGAFFLDETLRWYHFAGAALIVAGVIGANRTKKGA